MRIAFLTPAGLNLLDETGVRTYESAFGKTVRERHLSIQRRHGWKSEGRGARFMSGGLLWGMPGKDPADLRIAVTSVTARPGGAGLLFALDSDGLDAVFSLSLPDLVERRLLHGSEKRLRYLSASPDGTRVACSVGHRDGSASLGVMTAEATDLVEATEGDSVDLAPSWVPGRDDELVYQSAGIGRDRSGAPVGLGPFVVHRLQLTRGEVVTVLESPAHDFLGPKSGADGSLYAIRRPYRGDAKTSLLRGLLDFVLLPFRLVWAIFQYLNFFSTKYAGKPLTTAGGPKRQGADARQMMVWGNLIDAEEAARQAAREEGEPPSVVPRSWELVRRNVDGTVTALASGVVSFDVAPDGAVVYSTGSAIYGLSPSGDRKRLIQTPGIEQVVLA